MKKVFSFLVAGLLTASVLFAQSDFNGRIKYSFDAAGEGIEQAAGMLPNAVVITILKQSMITEYEGGMLGMMLGKMMVDGKKGKSYMIKDAEETVYTMPTPDKDDDMEIPEPSIEKTDETMMIAGYECTKYAVTTETPMGPQTSFLWASDQVAPAKPKKGGGMNVMGMGGGMAMDGLPGIPLKMEMTMGPISMILEAVEIDKTTPDKKMFKLPKGYDKEEFDPGMFGGGGGGGMGF